MWRISQPKKITENVNFQPPKIRWTPHPPSLTCISGVSPWAYTIMWKGLGRAYTWDKMAKWWNMTNQSSQWSNKIVTQWVKDENSRRDDLMRWTGNSMSWTQRTMTRLVVLLWKNEKCNNQWQVVLSTIYLLRWEAEANNNCDSNRTWIQHMWMDGQ